MYVHYVLDLAEIPTLREGARVRSGAFPSRAALALVLRLDGRRVPLGTLRSRAASRPGVGGLDTLRFEALYAAEVRGTRLEYRDGGFPGRVGWNEVVVSASDGARIVRSSAPASSVSDALGAYPKDLLREPLEVTSATAVFRPGSGAGTPPALGGGVPDRRESRIEALVSHDVAPGLVLLSLALALFWGAAHALGPGHGKAIVAGYLVGARGTARHAVLLGLVVTVTHTIGVFALGLVTLALSEFVLREQLYPWLNLVSGLLVVAVGVAVVRSRIGDWAHARAHARGEHHDHGHSHGHSHGHGTTTESRTRGGAWSGSASRAGSCRARPPSSSCSRRSRSTASATGCS